jgi:hypothetical protein
MPDAIIIGSGKTKITAPVAGRSWSWQQDIWQVTRPVWLAWLHSIGVRSCAADWASGAPFVSGCLCARHIVPVQHVILLAWKAAPHAGAQSNIAASRHTHAPRFLPGATGTWSLCFMVESENYTSTCVCYPSAAETQVLSVAKGSVPGRIVWHPLGARPCASATLSRARSPSIVGMRAVWGMGGKHHPSLSIAFFVRHKPKSIALEIKRWCQ